MFPSHVLRGAVLLALSLTVASAAVFDFNSIPSGTTTPFADTQGGITATFASAPGYFSTSDTFFFLLTGQVLLDQDTQLNSLNITFSQAVSSLSLVFALNNTAGSGNLFLTAYSGGIGGTVVGSTSAAGTVPSGYTYTEGTLVFTGGVFDAVTITSDQQDFAVDNIEVSGTIPEPGSIGLLLGGLAGIFGLRRLSRREPAA